MPPPLPPRPGPHPVRRVRRPALREVQPAQVCALPLYCMHCMHHICLCVVHVPTRAPSVPRAPRVVPAQPGPYSQEQVRAAFREGLYGLALHPPLEAGPKTLAMRPLNRNLQSAELDWETLLKKLTKVRNEMRVLEGKLNGEKNLSLQEEVAHRSHTTL